jgi:1-deoxy-D-xylulose-5-phosphate reductoisomerase
MKKKIVILGVSGSIGRSTIDVVNQHRDRLDVVGLSVHTDTVYLKELIDKFNPQAVAVTNEKSHAAFASDFHSKTCRLLEFENGVDHLAALDEADIVLNAIVGAAGLNASMVAVKAGKRLALANKESMVIGGELLNSAAIETGAEITPVDSEHSAIFQALQSGNNREVKRLLLTGSGGPFRELPLSEFSLITKVKALSHPTWNMGPKITIDSATMANKGLEIIEAVRLFQIPPDKIEVVIHPQSIVHSMVEFVDSSIIAQMSTPDMRLPIVYALFYPERVTSEFGQLNLAEQRELTFYRPDFEKFPLLKLAFEIAKKGGTYPAVFNAANEVAVAMFLNETIDFCMISDIVINAVEKHSAIVEPTLTDILNADKWSREMAVRRSGVKN